MDELAILTTGGTIDKVYFDAESEFQVGHPVIEDLLQRMNVGFTVSMRQVMRVDSLDMTDEHRKVIQQAVLDVNAQHILITHGTDGMVETASWLANIKDKKIILQVLCSPLHLLRMMLCLTLVVLLAPYRVFLMAFISR